MGASYVQFRKRKGLFANQTRYAHNRSQFSRMSCRFDIEKINFRLLLLSAMDYNK